MTIFELHFSRYLASFMLISHLGAAAILMMLPLAHSLCLLGVIICLGNFAILARTHLLRRGSRAITKMYLNQNEWYLLTATQNRIPATLLSQNFVTPWLVVLNFKTSTSRKLAIPLFRDALDVSSFRRLRVQVLTDATPYSLQDDSDLTPDNPGKRMMTREIFLQFINLLFGII
jgi:hypothetical protein